eukprot:m.62850 g.62850  ORF g.62850 m.62850 type:complete len:879 (+) comp11928_c0_seq4:318-2954(+)
MRCNPRWLIILLAASIAAVSIIMLRQTLVLWGERLRHDAERILQDTGAVGFSHHSTINAALAHPKLMPTMRKIIHGATTSPPESNVDDESSKGAIDRLSSIPRSDSKSHDGLPSHDSNVPATERVNITVFSIAQDIPFNEFCPQQEDCSDIKRRHLHKSYPQGVAAVSSWLAIQLHVVLYASDVTCDLFAVMFPIATKASRLMCMKHRCVHPQFGVPQLDCVFDHMQNVSQSEAFIYANTDIMFMPELYSVVSSLFKAYGHTFFGVGKRIDVQTSPSVGLLSTMGDSACDLNLQRCSTALNNIWDPLLQFSLNHNRNGIDFFLFSRQHRIKLPPFLVGRIEWDQWLLLSQIADRTITTVEVSDALRVLHIKHGVSKASHSKDGTLYNQNLALKLPHPHVQDHVEHHGTIWLGRLDEVDALLLRNVNAENREHARAMDLLKTVHSAGLAESMRDSDTYFTGKYEPTSPFSMNDTLTYIPNLPTLQTSLYCAHTTIRGKRAVTLVPVISQFQLMYIFEFAQREKFNNVLYVTSDASVWYALLARQLPVHLLRRIDPRIANPSMTVLQAAELMLRVLYHGYSAMLLNPYALPRSSAEAFVAKSAENSDVVIATLRGPSTYQHAADFIFARSRARTFELWTRVVQASLADATPLVQSIQSLARQGKTTQVVHTSMHLLTQTLSRVHDSMDGSRKSIISDVSQMTNVIDAGWRVCEQATPARLHALEQAMTNAASFGARHDVIAMHGQALRQAFGTTAQVQHEMDVDLDEGGDPLSNEEGDHLDKADNTLNGTTSTAAETLIPIGQGDQNDGSKDSNVDVHLNSLRRKKSNRDALIGKGEGDSSSLNDSNSSQNTAANNVSQFQEEFEALLVRPDVDFVACMA